MRLRGPGARVEAAERLSGGASMETWAFVLVSPAGREALILRRRGAQAYDPDGSHISLAAEAALLRAVAAKGAPAPPMVHLCDDQDGLGEGHVTRRVAGETLGRKILDDPRFDAVRPRLAGQCGEILARIHATPPPAQAQLVLETGPAVLARYEATYRQMGCERPILELAFRHLSAHAPPPMEPVLLHGDFRNGNLVVDPVAGVAAVLDWELAHRGDPAEDLGWICVNSWRFGRPDRPVGGFGAYADLLEGYARAGGTTVTLPRLRYWQALGSLKWAVICLKMYASWATGVATSVERPMIGRRVSEAEIDLVHLLEAGL
ncbi:MAG: hypothetical protein JWQ97_3646 [Phenylobacterium sp.]|nr:hypothetical protein [Phenylobacterium sp.]